MRALLLFAAVAMAGCSKSPPRGAPADAPANTAEVTAGPSRPSAPITAAPSARVTLTGAQGAIEVEVEVVKSSGRIQRGLMYRKYLAPEAGMLFLMGDNSEHHFWMHNTLIPLDIMFIGEDHRVVGILENMQPQDDTSRSVGKPSLYVLEVNGGFSKAHGIGPGTEVRFDGVEAAAR